MSDFDSLTSAFQHQAQAANGIIGAHALQLFFALAAIEIIWQGILILNHMTSIEAGVVDLIGVAAVGALVRNSYSWGLTIVHGFEVVGQQVSGQPSLNPQAIYDLGRQLSETIYAMPTMAGPIDEIKVLLAQTIAAWIIDMAFLVIGALATLAYIGVLFLLAILPIAFALGALTWTADGMWHGISALVRMGMLLLGFYLVIAAGLTFAHSIVDRANAECAPVATAVPWVMSYYVPPTSIVINACSNSLPASSLLIYVADSLLLAIVSIWVPFYLSGIVAGAAHTSAGQLMGGARELAKWGGALIG